jgi:hypothetical protein
VPHARFPEIRIDGDFHEHGAERMHRKPHDSKRKPPRRASQGGES